LYDDSADCKGTCFTRSSIGWRSGIGDYAELWHHVVPSVSVVWLGASNWKCANAGGNKIYENEKCLATKTVFSFRSAFLIVTTVTEDARETTFLFRRLSMALQRWKAIFFHSTMFCFIEFLANFYRSILLLLTSQEATYYIGHNVRVMCII